MQPMVTHDVMILYSMPDEKCALPSCLSAQYVKDVMHAGDVTQMHFSR